MASLQDPVKTIKGIGEKRAKAFEKLGVSTLSDLISFFPRRYEDRSNITPIACAGFGAAVCICAVVADEPRLYRVRRGMELVRFKAVDNTGIMTVTYFNQSWMKKNIHRGEEYVFYGTPEKKGSLLCMANPVYERSDTENGVTGRIIPVYHACRGLTQKNILQSIRAGLDTCGGLLNEWIPPSVLESRKLTPVREAYEAVHFPTDAESLSRAKKRLIYEELFLLACAMNLRRNGRLEKKGRMLLPFDAEVFYHTLPFQPTNAQKRCISEALQDMTSGRAMNRLIQGDVGSGKTLCAAALIWFCWKNGLVSAFMAPTEILAQQHFRTLEAMLSPLGIRIGILTGSMRAKERATVLKALEEGGIDLLIGTHALFSGDVSYPNLGLVITDEQHRFGVGQRAALIGKGDMPHVLVMSATPIPRTLALILYGDLDISVLDEMPPGRKQVDTFFVDSRYRERLNRFIMKQAEQGNQCYVICPKVEDDEGENDLQLLSAESHAAYLQKALPGLRIGCVHGRLKAEEKDAAMDAFSSGRIDVLVATTVVEVGVDVPNATLMIIENAERFGLSQLHQLRGRVGRGKARSYCVLVSDHDSADVKDRLSILCRTNDGFRIAEEDLRLRGPGDFFGERQHGLPEMRAADLWADAEILKQAKADADLIFSRDASLSLPEHAALHEKVKTLLDTGTSTMN